MIVVGPLLAEDRAAWEELFAGYNAFYGRTWPAELYNQAWQRFHRGDEIHALGRLYWHTQLHNETARRLYDQVAEFRDFIVYPRQLD